MKRTLAISKGRGKAIRGITRATHPAQVEGSTGDYAVGHLAASPPVTLHVTCHRIPRGRTLIDTAVGLYLEQGDPQPVDGVGLISILL